MAQTDARYGKCQFFGEREAEREREICFHDKTNKAIQEDVAAQSLLWMSACFFVCVCG